MKVGVDAVLLGCWVEAPGSDFLDVGTGCGVISLILAQRFPKANILAIDIDNPSIEEAAHNFRKSPWEERLAASPESFPKDTLCRNASFSLIISNPHYFKSVINEPVTRREKARHQDSLSIFSLLENSGRLLKPEGNLAMIFPAEFYESAVETGRNNGFFQRRVCFVKDNENRPEKRVMMQFGTNEIEQPEVSHLTLFDGIESTEDYRFLCKDFYLKF